jgi:hypothetical protein
MHYIALVAALAAPSRAAADALSLFGAGARAEGLAGAMAGEASGWAAAIYNPAGVARANEVEAAVGYGYGFARLTLDGQDAGVTSPRGTTLGLAVPIALGRVVVAFGLALYLPDQFLARVRTVPSNEPRFVLLDNDPDRIVVAPVLALRLARWISIGAGATLLADASGHGVEFDVGVVGGEKVGRAALDVSLPLRAAPLAGVTVEPRPWLRAGLSYRGALDLGVALDILAHVDVAAAVKGDTQIALRATQLYTPQRVALGVAADPVPSLTLLAELAWENWAAFRGGLPDLRVLVALNASPSLPQAQFPPDNFRDVWVPRLGVEYRRRIANRLTLAGRAGYAYQRSPVPDQVGLTSFADGDRHLVALGAGVALEPVGRLAAVLTRPLRIDLALGWHELVGRTTEKDPRLGPGSGFSAGGRIVHLSATVEARF